MPTPTNVRITSKSLTYSQGAGPELAGTTVTMWTATDNQGRHIASSPDPAALEATIDRWAADQQPVQLRFADGSARTVKASTERLLAGLDEHGHLVVAADFNGDDGQPYLYSLTDCCQASGKGGEHGIVCRSCYQPVDFCFADEAELTVPYVRSEG